MQPKKHNPTERLKMYKPTKNFHQTWMNMVECAVFKQAAMKEAQERFNALLSEESFELLVQSMLLEERVRVYDEVIEELLADDLA